MPLEIKANNVFPCFAIWSNFYKKSKSLILSLYIIRSYQSNVGGVIMKCNKMNRVQLKEGSVSMTL
ncbi:tetracycline resistance efflux system leader peptide [Bacillus subtilis]|nr:tetracycline resistance efflux system leader peptide [Bacillus subtilis]